MKKIIITEENSKQRIDRFLVRELFSYTRGEIINNIKNGNVTANGKIVKPSYGLKINDELEIRIKKEKTKLVPNKRVRPEIIYSDKDIIVINKPAGLQVHPVESTSSTHGVSPSDTLVHGLLNNFPEIKNVNDGSTGSELRPGIVHRLDKDTTGVMVVVRNQSAFDELKKLFQKRKVKKEYLAVIFGKLKNKKGIIEKPVARSKNYKKQTVASARTKTKIRTAVTEYEVLKEYDEYSLVRAMPKTGRMHQVRVHLASLGHPIVGDGKYRFKNTISPRSVRRQLLHSSKLKFEIFGKKHSFAVPLPTDFYQFLKSLDEGKIKS